MENSTANQVAGDVDPKKKYYSSIIEAAGRLQEIDLQEKENAFEKGKELSKCHATIRELQEIMKSMEESLVNEKRARVQLETQLGQQINRYNLDKVEFEKTLQQKDNELENAKKECERLKKKSSGLGTMIENLQLTNANQDVQLEETRKELEEQKSLSQQTQENLDKAMEMNRYIMNECRFKVQQLGESGPELMSLHNSTVDANLADCKESFKYFCKALMKTNEKYRAVADQCSELQQTTQQTGNGMSCDNGDDHIQIIDEINHNTTNGARDNSDSLNDSGVQEDLEVSTVPENETASTATSNSEPGRSTVSAEKENRKQEARRSYISPRYYKCGICKKRFSVLSRLRSHKKSHNQRKGPILRRAPCRIRRRPNISLVSPSQILEPPSVQSTASSTPERRNPIVVLQRLPSLQGSPRSSINSPLRPNNQDVVTPRRDDFPITSSYTPYSVQEMAHPDHGLDRTIAGSVYCTCGLNFNSLTTLLMHVQYFGDGQRFRCDVDTCGKTNLKGIKGNNLHCKTAHPEVWKQRFQNSGRAACTKCGVIFGSKHELDRHRFKIRNRGRRLEYVCPLALRLLHQ